MDESKNITFDQFCLSFKSKIKAYLLRQKGPNFLEKQLKKSEIILKINDLHTSSDLDTENGLFLIKRQHAIDALSELPKEICHMVKDIVYLSNILDPQRAKRAFLKLGTKFSHLHNLTFGAQKASYLYPGISQFKKLAFLKINCNNTIRDFSALSKGPSIKHLVLQTPPADPSVFSTLIGSEIETLEIRANQFEHIPKSMFSIKSLKKIVFKRSEKKIKGFKGIRKGELNKNLEILMLNHQGISRIPKTFLQLKGLKELYLDSNKFKQFPEVLLNLKSLELLLLQNNAIEKLPKKMPEDSSVKCLVLTRNKIRKLDQRVLKMQGLERLYLVRNPLHTIDPALKNRKFWLRIDLKFMGEDFWDNLSQWSPDRLIHKIKESIPLSPSDLVHPDLLRYSDFIIWKCQKYKGNKTYQFFSRKINQRRKKRSNNGKFSFYL